MAKDGIARFSRQPAAYWLIFKEESGQAEALTVDLDGLGKALPVFSFEEEAWMFALLPAARDGWQVRQITAGEKRIAELTHLLMECIIGSPEQI